MTKSIYKFPSATVSRSRVLLLLAADSAATALAMLAAVFLRLGLQGGTEYLNTHHLAIVMSWGMFLVALGVAGLYEGDCLHRLGKMVAASLVAVTVGTFLISAVFYVTSSVRLGRGIFLSFAGLVFISLVLTRLVYRLISGLGFMTHRTLIVGTNGEARGVIELVREHPHSGIKIVGLVQCGKDRIRVGTLIAGYPVLGTEGSLEHLVKTHHVERLILAAPVEVESELLRRLRSFRYRGVALGDFLSLNEELTHQISLEHIDEQWLFTAAMTNSRFHIRYLKGAFDIIVALAGLALSAPICVLASIFIKLEDPRAPVLYRQERLGRDGAPFTILKFRTMKANAESECGPVWAREDDPRITTVGKWLRKYRIDEIPQLFNVLRGEMSLTGPRPEREVFVKELSEKIPFYAERLLVHPGLTGWAQVMYPYAASIEATRRKLQYDLYYIKHMSLSLDLYILLCTVKIVLFGRERPKLVRSETPAVVPETDMRTRDFAFASATVIGAKQLPTASVSRK